MMRLFKMGVCMGMLAALGQAAPISCGSLASPKACSVQVAGQVEYVFSNFVIGAENGLTAEEVGIEVDSGGGLTGLVTFRKLNAQTGISFFANAGQTKSVSFLYDVQVNALQPGTAAFAAPGIVTFGATSAVNNGFGQLQMILSHNSIGESCVATWNVNFGTQGVCNTLPPGTTNGLTVGNIFTVSGANGNAAALSLRNLLDATFTPESNGGGDGGGDGAVPEPSTWALMGAGLGLLGWRGARRR